MNSGMLIALTGGIGSGKSVVRRIVGCLGYPVYDCDSRAKLLMDASSEIRSRIAGEIDACAVDAAGNIDRRRLAASVFADAHKLERLNTIVHAEVLADIRRWRSEIVGTAFVETAILYQSGLHRLVDEVWEVTAPRELRIERVMARNRVTAAEVEARMESQQYVPERIHPCTRVIVNDGTRAVLPQIIGLLGD